MEEKNYFYAGFWRRFAAYLIDQLLLGAVHFVLFIPLYFFFGLGIFTLENFEEYEDFSNVTVFQYYDDDLNVAVITAVILLVLVISVVSLVIQWLYYSLMESSAKQATLGKMALGIKVIDMDGNRIKFGRATGRYFGKILSGLILNIGYIMAGFTAKKQALHDMLANCLVIIDKPYDNYKQGELNETEQIDSAS